MISSDLRLIHKMHKEYYIVDSGKYIGETQGLNHIIWIYITTDENLEIFKKEIRTLNRLITKYYTESKTLVCKQYFNFRTKFKVTKLLDYKTKKYITL